MKKSVIITAILLGITISGCGASGDASNSNAIAKEDVCTLLTTAEVSNLVGEAVNEGKRDTKHTYPNASVCTWTSVSHNMPLLTLTYYLHTSAYALDHYALPGSQIKKLNGTSNEAIAVLGVNKKLSEVIARSGNNAVLLMSLSLESKEGSKNWNNEIKLTDLAAQRAEKKK
ncbi:hypothetical protein YH65_04575 [Sulfurovum lithotrophicum]|uniref:DUF3558 domain-containing protein n=1 Tax=Sulfurovum lithotrophicum TaxID=206403 RepID=A0A7U4M0T4_9BACT|nr:hypothetical protein [Sulfurovum lithotrophicum]AKF24740.1 hypothetical protein YH65_04575 [Sulfurovum lithotrophicum]